MEHEKQLSPRKQHANTRKECITAELSILNLPFDIWASLLLTLLPSRDIVFIIKTVCKALNNQLDTELVWRRTCKQFLQHIAKEQINPTYYDPNTDYFKDYTQSMFDRYGNWFDSYKNIYLWHLPSYCTFTEDKVDKEDFDHTTYEVPKMFNYGDMLCLDATRLCGLYFVVHGKLVSASKEQNDCFTGCTEIAPYIISSKMKYEEFFEEHKYSISSWYYRGDDTRVINLLGKPLPGHCIVEEETQTGWFRFNPGNNTYISFRGEQYVTYERVMSAMNPNTIIKAANI